MWAQRLSVFTQPEWDIVDPIGKFRPHSICGLLSLFEAMGTLPFGFF